MAAICASLVAVPAAAAQAKAPAARKSSLVAAPAHVASPAVSNVNKARDMMVWEPTNNKYFETFSYLPPLTDDQISKQVDFIVNSGFVPCLEFSAAEFAYVDRHQCAGMQNVCGYYDNRYWTMYKLPMFGCTDPGQVLTEIANCTKSFPDAYIRLVAFDSVRQVQCTVFLVHRPDNAIEHAKLEDRSR